MRAREFLFDTIEDPLGTMLGQKGLAPMPTGPSEIDQTKLDQIMQRLSEPEPVQQAAQAVAPTKPATKLVSKAPAKPKVYVPVTNSPFEISIRKAALGAKIVGAELAAFLGQCAHESAKFTTTKEFSDGTQYEGRKDLGNIKPGDGAKYKGRGFIQITGRANYTQAAKDLGIDLVNHPELAERPDVAIKVSLWYWKTRVQPKISNFNNTKAVTKKVNGGLRGLDKREKYTQSFKVANRAIQEVDFGGQDVEGNALVKFKEKYPNLSTVMYFIPGFGQALLAADLASQVQMYNQAITKIEQKYPTQTIQSVQQKVGDAGEEWETL